MTADEQLTGLDLPKSDAGWTQQKITAAIAAAALDDRDLGMGAVAIACARGVDLAQYRRDPFAIAAATRELRETLIRLRMDPASRLGVDAGEVGSWLATLDAAPHEETTGG